MLTQPHRLRRLALHVLVMWLFALGSGIANACVVQLHMLQPAHSAAAAAVHDDGQSAATMDEEVADCATVHGHLPNGGAMADKTHPACERLCGAPSVAPQPEKPQFSLLSGFWLAPAPVPSFDFRPSIEALRIAPSEDARWPQPIPIAIAFLRLAL